MSKILRLYNTFTKSYNELKLSGKLIQTNQVGPPIHGSLYICGPTVYSDCHVGHALTYIRSDLLRRFLKSFFNVRLITVMNITDIDDKILARSKEEYGSSHDVDTDPSSHPYNQISEKYFKSFIADMELVKNLPADMYMLVSKQVPAIRNFIAKLEENKQAYRAENGDIYFKVASVPNYVGRVDARKEKATATNEYKQEIRDFALWKKAKPGEPVWLYKSRVDGYVIPGRPGWHVQCSAISSSIFGQELDIHYGGKDLIFPHHYNEEACCCAYHNLDTSESLHVWTKHWLHSGHMVLADTKMSKSLGNVIPIKDFVERTSVNALRLLCVHSHYRADIKFNDGLIDNIRSIDHKINAFYCFLREALAQKQNSPEEIDLPFIGNEVERAITSTYDAIASGVCEDLDLNQGLNAILDLSKLLYSLDPKAIRPSELVASLSLLKNWSDTCGLNYGISGDSLSTDLLLNLLVDYRQSVRLWAIKELKSRQTREDKQKLQQLLVESDKVRGQIDELGFVIRDPKAK